MHVGQKLSIRVRLQSNDSKRDKSRIRSRRYREKVRKTLKKKNISTQWTAKDADVRGCHLAKHALVEYRPSTIPGAGGGVFACKDLKIGDCVTWFDGTLCNDQPSDPTYVIQLGVRYLDGIRKPKRLRGLGSFINREERQMSGKRKNCVLVPIPNQRHKVYVEMVATVKAGKELLTTYGREYRLGVDRLDTV